MALSRQDSLSRALAGLRPGTSLRVLLRLGLFPGPFVSDSDRLLEGPLLCSADSALVLSRDGRDARLRFADIDALWVLGNSSKKGAVLGAVTLGVVGAACFFFREGLRQAFLEPCCSRDERGAGPLIGAALTGAALGSALGATVGGLLGWPIHEWHRRYP